VLGLTGPLLQPLLASRWLGWLRHLAHPWSRCRSGRSTSTSGTSPPLSGALGNEALHGLQHACFIGLAC
jgi:hypothetical protein